METLTELKEKRKELDRQIKAIENCTKDYGKARYQKETTHNGKDYHSIKVLRQNCSGARSSFLTLIRAASKEEAISYAKSVLNDLEVLLSEVDE